MGPEDAVLPPRDEWAQDRQPGEAVRLLTGLWETTARMSSADDASRLVAQAASTMRPELLAELLAEAVSRLARGPAGV